MKTTSQYTHTQIYIYTHAQVCIHRKLFNIETQKVLIMRYYLSIKIIAYNQNEQIMKSTEQTLLMKSKELRVFEGILTNITQH